VSTQFGDRDTSFALLRRANEILPGNALVRNRYAISLTPRWGGSYKQLDQFIADTKGERVPASVVLQLEAIEHNDKGLSLEEQHQHDAAMEHFRRSLEIADRVGGTFAKEFLEPSRYYGCSGQNAPTSCQ
ncbi:MAG: tetratricopeptide repeat protein, partial [Gammaproteobacteria bacterium]